MARDYHSLWLSSAALAAADGDLQVDGGVVELDDDGEPTGVLREESAWHFRDRYLLAPDDEFVDAMREGLKIVAARGVTAVHDKDGWLGAPRFWQRLADEEALTLRVWQSLPYDHVDRLGELGLRAGLGDDLLRIGYLKVFMDGTLGSQTARLLDGSGVKITGRRGAGRDRPRRRRARAGRSPCTRSATSPTARRSTRSRRPATNGRRSDCASGSSTPSSWPRRTCGRFAELGVAASVQFSHAPSDRDLADRIWEGNAERAYAYRSLVESGAVVANGSDAPIEELDPLAGIRAGVLRTLDEREPGTRSRRSRSSRRSRRRSSRPPGSPATSGAAASSLPGFLADLVVLDRDPLDDPARGTTRGSGRRDDARRPLGAQPATLGLTRATAARRARCRALSRSRRRVRCARCGSARSASGCSPRAGRSR